MTIKENFSCIFIFVWGWGHVTVLHWLRAMMGKRIYRRWGGLCFFSSVAFGNYTSLL
jgi:hypothetical protein